ncbi:MAG: hypothetical protein DRG78_24745 [Epsilonproteobacteria bacterium]|nr:MAG: hypothetical protein DRG78_24745 [Campylobacterota bacterium]
MLNLNQLKELYVKSPNWVKSIYSSIPYNIRNGQEYIQWIALLEKELNVEEYEIVKLKETILYAYDNTLYYKNLFDKNNINPYEINSRNDIQDIPFLTKKLIRENFYDLQAVNYPTNKKFSVSTGGTTGDTVKFIQSQNVWKKELAFVNNFFHKYDCTPNQLKVSFKIGNYKYTSQGIFWKKDYIHNSIHFSPLHLNAETVKYYVQEINKLKPLFFHIYPSNLLFLIDFMIEQNLFFNYQIHTIFLVSEGYLKEDIVKIKSFFNCNVVSFYGHSERILFAESISSYADIYQIDKRYGLLELINDNKQIVDNDIVANIVGTSFDNYAMPLIRYKTDDNTMYLDYNNNKISLIDSLRNQVYIDTANGMKISITSFSFSAFVNKIKTWQIYQEEPGKIEIVIVPNNNFTQKDKDGLELSISKDIKDVIQYKIKFVNQPLFTSRGKMVKMNKKPVKPLTK